eukprot:1139858-Pelagomonas_calceolata.AAC.12
MSWDEETGEYLGKRRNRCLKSMVNCNEESKRWREEAHGAGGWLGQGDPRVSTWGREGGGGDLLSIVRASTTEDDTTDTHDCCPIRDQIRDYVCTWG